MNDSEFKTNYEETRMNYKCITCSHVVGEIEMNNLFKTTRRCPKCGGRGWLEHKPQSLTSKAKNDD